MIDISYSLTPTEKKPKTKRKPKGSKYALIIDAFLESREKLVKVENTELEANYLSGQLNKLIKKMGIDSVNVSVRNNEVFLEKI